MQDRSIISGKSIRVLGLVFTLALAAISASADTLTVSEIGGWGALIPVTAESAPNETWSFSFDVDSKPAVSDVVPGGYFNPVITDAVFYLNGVPVPGAITSTTFFSSSDAGLLDLEFADGNSIYEYGPVLYSGPESSPTILVGVYPIGAGSTFNLNTVGQYEPVTGYVIVSSTPEPSSLLLLGSGLAGLGGLLRRKLRI